MCIKIDRYGIVDPEPQRFKTLAGSGVIFLIQNQEPGSEMVTAKQNYFKLLEQVIKKSTQFASVRVVKKDPC